MSVPLCPTCAGELIEIRPDGATCARGHFVPRDPKTGRLLAARRSDGDPATRTAGPLEHQQESSSSSSDGKSGKSGRESGAFRLTALGDLLAEPEEAVAWLVEGMLPSGGVSLLAAKPKVGKSTTARCLALAVARGEPFLGRQTAQGTVVYLALEEKRAEVAKHFRRQGATENDPVHVHVGVAPEQAIDALAEVIATYRPALVIVDPLLRWVRVRDANDYAEVTRALEPVIELARASGCHILLVHHLAKGERTGGDAILGSTALFGSVDTAILMRRQQDGTRTIETIQRYGEDLPESVIVLDEKTGTVTLAGTTAERKQAEAEAAILDALGSDPLTEPEIRDAVQLQGLLVSRALRSLVERGAVRRTGTGRRGDPYRYARAGEEQENREEREEREENSEKPAIAESREENTRRRDADFEGTSDSLPLFPVYQWEEREENSEKPAHPGNGRGDVPATSPGRRCSCGGVFEPSDHDGWLRCSRCRTYVRANDPALRRGTG